MRDKMKGLFPPGYEYEAACKRCLALLAAGVVYSFRFFFQYYEARRRLYEWVYLAGVRKKVLREGARIASFAEVIDYSFLFFVPLMLVLFAEIIELYLYYRRGSKSIYLVKRLPDQWFLSRTCVAAPLIGIGLTVLIVAGLLSIYYGVYICFTPAGCLP